ncbi:hypothetical protein ACOJR9_04160 [Alteromonas sp. A081]|uniref:hypothetical protein n=1 Tax=Alteromonas sp. A081 TaxID=3410269 RepID=UPI003B9851E4
MNKYFSLALISTIAGMASTIARDMSVDSPPVDFLLGSAPSFFFIMGMLFFSKVMVANDKYNQKYPAFVLLGTLLYEIEQIWSSRVFDIYDILALLLGYFLFLIIIWALGVELKKQASTE